MTIIYEYKVEEVDEDGDIQDCNHYDSSTQTLLTIWQCTILFTL